MPYHISWHIENQVVHVRFRGEVSDADLIQSSEAICDMLVGSDRAVHILYDGISLRDLACSMSVIKQALRRFCRLPSMGWLVFTGFSSPDLRYVSNAIMQVMMRNFKHAHSLEDVDFILQQIDPSLETAFARSGV